MCIYAKGCLCFLLWVLMETEGEESRRSRNQSRESGRRLTSSCPEVAGISPKRKMVWDNLLLRMLGKN